jgi:hypothetical protein
MFWSELETVIVTLWREDSTRMACLAPAQWPITLKHNCTFTLAIVKVSARQLTWSALCWCEEMFASLNTSVRTRRNYGNKKPRGSLAATLARTLGVQDEAGGKQTTCSWDQQSISLGTLD